MSELDQPTPKGISRRTVAKAMAWSVPVVAVAAAVPAYAASGAKPIITPGPACKLPGQSCQTLPGFGYVVQSTVQNPDTTKSIFITAVSVTGSTCGNLTGAAISSPTLPIEVPAGGTITVFFRAFATNSQNQTDCSFNFLVTWGHESDGSDDDHQQITVPIIITSTPPNCPCPPAPAPQ